MTAVGAGTAEATALASATLMVVLDGLVALHLAQYTNPDEMARAHERAPEELADVIAEAGDRLTAPGNFTSREDRRERSRVLNAMAACLALGAYKDGGVAWNGAHWCTRPHVNCVNTPNGTN